MIKSEERNTEFCVIARPRYRDHPPICYKGYAKDKVEAANAVFNSDWHKEILDVKSSCEIEWNNNTIKEYWKKYGEPFDGINANKMKFF